jgi:hypothetical protein
MSEDGQDDSVMPYIDTVKSMSSNQLKLHYCIYAAFQTIFNKQDTDILLKVNHPSVDYWIGIPIDQLNDKFSSISQDLTALEKHSLINQFAIISNIDKTIVAITPTLFGIQLFAAAHNDLINWKDFGRQTYQPVHEIPVFKNILDKEAEIFKQGQVSFSKLKPISGLG